MAAKRHVASAVFIDNGSAERCVTQLRLSGVPDDAISIIAKHEDGAEAFRPDGSEVDHGADSKASGMAKGAASGATVGALFGLAAIFIPGFGPFISAGAFASTLGAAGGAAASGAIVGGVAGTLAGAIMDYGVSKEDAELYVQQLNDGGVIVLVDKEKVPDNVQVESLLATHGGRSSAFSR